MAPTVRQLQQNLLNTNHAPLEVTSLLETELDEEKIAHLLGKTADTIASENPFTIGLSGGYTSSGILNTLAVAVGSKVFLIQFRSKTKSSDAAVTEARKLLTDYILCRPQAGATLYAFDLAPLALQLYGDHSLLIENGIDVQSGCACADQRDPVAATEFATTSTKVAKIYPDNIRDAFSSVALDQAKPETSRALSLRAWLASFVPTLGYMEERFREVPKINTKSMPADRLLMLAQFARTSQLQDANRPQQTTHDFIPTASDGSKFKLESSRFQTRLRGKGTRIEMTVQDRHGGEFVMQAKSRDVSGRQGTLKAAGTVQGKVVTSVSSIDADKQTMAEQRRDATILAILQGTSPLFDNPFLRTIWPDAEEVEWPEEAFPTSDTPPPLSYLGPLNESQQSAVESMLTLSNDSRLVLIQGPPGTGKTTVIGAFVQSAIDSGWGGIWLMAQSNVAVKNIAEKLDKIGFTDFRLLVSKDFHFGWHEHLYHTISRNIIRSDSIPKAVKGDALKGVKVILSTLSMLSNPRLDLVTSKVPLKYMVVDEASQIAVSDYIAPLETFKTLQKICFIGDDKQLPPYGQDEIEDLQSIFEISHLREKAKFLDIQYRMPPHVGEMISAAVYDGQLRSNPEHEVKGPAVWLVDVDGSTERQQKTSWENLLECDAVIKIAESLQNDKESFRIITPYEAQRSLIEATLKQKGLSWANKCFNVDSFQGNEDDYIIISLVRSRDLGFLRDLRRTNVMLTRCKRGMFICSSWSFLVEGKGAHSLVGRMAAECGDDAWLSMEDLETGNF